MAEAPAIELWLGPLSTVADRQTHTWRRTFSGGPVRNTQGLAGNSVPAAYLFDPVTGIETILHVDASALEWAPRRLLDLELRELFDYGGSRYGLGLVPSRPFPLLPGRHVFRWRLWQRRASGAPDSWQASARLVDVLADGLDGVGQMSGGPVSWERIAAGVVGDLLDASQVQVTVPSGTDTVFGLRAYVRDAPGFYEPEPDRFELMTVADVVPPLLLYLRLHPDEAARELVGRLHASLPRFHRPERTTDLEPVPGRRGRAGRRHLVPVPQRPHQAALGRADPRRRRAQLDRPRGTRRSGRARDGDQWPAAAVRRLRPGPRPRPAGSAPNPSVAGLLAYAALLAEELGGSGGRDLARRLLVGLRHEPVALAYHEPLQLGFAAAAAARLADAGDAVMSTLADEFVRAQLRQVYWDEDPEAERRGYRVRGMFEACASLLYPALKENIEAILPWTELLRSGRGPTELLLKLMNLIRLHSLAFFDPLLPRPVGGPAPWIPYENLGTSELPGTGSIGKEVYGAGEAIWAYLLFEALARSDDPAILVVHVDLLDAATLPGYPARRRRFIVYNPTDETRSVRLALRALTGRAYRVSTAGRVVDRETLLRGVPADAARSVVPDDRAGGGYGVSRDLGIGLVGAGRFGAFCVGAFQDLPGARVVAVMDADRGRAEAIAPLGAAAYEDFDRLLDDPAVDIVHIGTPPYLHGPMARQAAERGKHVFVEKPLATTLADAHAAVDAARLAGVQLSIDYVLRHHPIHRLAIAVTRSNAFGRLQHFALENFASAANLPPEHWFWDPAQSGGIHIEHGVHFFDLAIALAGREPDVVSGTAQARSDGRTDRVAALCRFGDAMAATFYHSFTRAEATEQTTIRLAFERGHATIDGWIPTVLRFEGTVEADSLPTLTMLVGEPLSAVDGGVAAGTRNVLVSATVERLDRQNEYRLAIRSGMKELVAAIRDGAPLTVTPEDGVRSLRMAIMATEDRVVASR